MFNKASTQRPTLTSIVTNQSQDKNKNRNKIGSTDNADVRLNKIYQDTVKLIIESLRLRKKINHLGVSRRIAIFGFKIKVRVGRR